MSNQVLVRVIDLVDAAQKGFDAADCCPYAPISKQLRDLSETVLSGAIVVLRHRRAAVPVEVHIAMQSLAEAMDRADKLRA